MNFGSLNLHDVCNGFYRNIPLVLPLILTLTVFIEFQNLKKFPELKEFKIRLVECELSRSKVIRESPGPSKIKIINARLI